MHYFKLKYMEFHICTLGWFFVNLHKLDKKGKRVIIIFT